MKNIEEKIKKIQSLLNEDKKFTRLSKKPQTPVAICRWITKNRTDVAEVIRSISHKEAREYPMLTLMFSKLMNKK